MNIISWLLPTGEYYKFDLSNCEIVPIKKYKKLETLQIKYKIHSL